MFKFKKLIDGEIPLFTFLELTTSDAGNWDFTELEHNAAINRAKIACNKYYK